MGPGTGAERADRQSLRPLARPQYRVDAVRDDFPRSAPRPGVVDVSTTP